MNGLRSTIGIYSFHVLKLQSVLRPALLALGRGLVYSPRTTTYDTLVELKRIFTEDFTLTTSRGLGTVESQFPKA